MYQIQQDKLAYFEEQIDNPNRKISYKFTLNGEPLSANQIMDNPNLTTDTQAKVDETLAEIQSGALVVPVTAEELDTFLSEVGYQANTINYK